MTNEDIINVKNKEDKEKILKGLCPKCDTHTLGPSLDVPASKFGPISPESPKSTLKEYPCSKCHKRFRILKKD